ncbi:TPA: tyrosine-protein phosphatase [Neisseria subflava]
MRRLLLCLLASGLPIACSSASPDDGSKAVQSERWATPVKHDANLYRIDDKLYRSEQPVAEDGEAIVKLGIQSVINLRFFDRNDDDHLKAHGLTLLNRPLLSWSIKPKEIAEILYLIEKQQQNGAVLIHCYHGADRTGLIAGMYRIIYQGWPVEEAKAEMQHGPYGYHSIWKNIANLFTEEKVKQVKMHLEAMRKRG